MQSKSRNTNALLQIAFAGILFGTIPIFAALLRKQNISTILQVFFRLSVTAIILIPFVLRIAGRKLRPPKRRNILLFAANGLLLFAAFFTYILSVSLGTPVAKAVLLTYIYPLFAVLLGRLFLKETIDKYRLLSIALAMTGAAVVMEIWAIDNIAAVRPGEALAFFNSFLSASIIVLARFILRDNQKAHPLSVTFFSFVFALLWLALAASVFRFSPLKVFAPDLSFNFHLAALPCLLGIAVIATLIPYLLLYFGLRRIEASTAAVLLLIEPVSVFVMGLVFLAEPIRLSHLIGAVFILAAVFVSSRR